MPYRRAAQLLSEFLPLSSYRTLSPATVWRHTLAVGDQLDMRVTEPDEYNWPESRRLPVVAGERLAVAIDGTFIRADSSGWALATQRACTWRREDPLRRVPLFCWSLFVFFQNGGDDAYPRPQFGRLIGC